MVILSEQLKQQNVSDIQLVYYIPIELTDGIYFLGNGIYMMVYFYQKTYPVVNSIIIITNQIVYQTACLFIVHSMII